MTFSTGSGFSLSQGTSEIKVTFDSGATGVPLFLGDTKTYYTISQPAKISGWYLNGDVSGSVVVDIWKSSTGIPTNGDSITGTEKPSLTAQQQNNDTQLSSWNTALRPGDTLGFEIESVTDVTKAVLTLKLA
jgi:hypothetical protein